MRREVTICKTGAFYEKLALRTSEYFSFSGKYPD